MPWKAITPVVGDPEVPGPSWADGGRDVPPDLSRDVLRHRRRPCPGPGGVGAALPRSGSPRTPGGRPARPSRRAHPVSSSEVTRCRDWRITVGRQPGGHGPARPNVGIVRVYSATNCHANSCSDPRAPTTATACPADARRRRVTDVLLTTVSRVFPGRTRSIGPPTDHNSPVANGRRFAVAFEMLRVACPRGGSGCRRGCCSTPVEAEAALSPAMSAEIVKRLGDRFSPVTPGRSSLLLIHFSGCAP